MKKGMKLGKRKLTKELRQGKALAKELKKYIDPSFSTTGSAQILIDKIFCCYEKAFLILDSDASATIPVSNGSPTSQGSISQPCNFKDQNRVKKRRKTSRRGEEVKVCSKEGLEGPIEDGYCWRKYGQKDIFGSMFPRGYYRCTSRFAQNCLAKKHVQRSDDDPTMFNVVYMEKHTCNQASNFMISDTINFGSVDTPRVLRDETLLKFVDTKINSQYIDVSNLSTATASPWTSGVNCFDFSFDEIREKLSTPTFENNSVEVEDFNFSILDEFEFDSSLLFESMPQYFC